MSTDTPTKRTKHPRPSVVTLSCVFVAVTAFLTLTELISALMDWGTVGMQEGLQPLLKFLRLAGAEVTTTELLRVLRWAGLALVPFTVSALVFSIYAMRGDRVGRLMTTVLAVVGGLLSMALGVALIGAVGLLQASMLLLAAGALWSPDAGRWYRGEPAVTRANSASVDVLDPAPSSAPDSAADAPVNALPPPPSPGATPFAPAVGVRRPTSVMTAGLLTIFGSIAAGGFAALYLIIYTFARTEYIEAVKTGPFSEMITAKELELMMTVTFWMSVALLPLAVAGLLGASLLLAQRRVGRTATLCWAWATAALGLVLLPIGLLATAGAGAVIFLLARDDARQWTAG
jgi:hypothetical protein